MRWYLTGRTGRLKKWAQVTPSRCFQAWQAWIRDKERCVPSLMMLYLISLWSIRVSIFVPTRNLVWMHKLQFLRRICVRKCLTDIIQLADEPKIFDERSVDCFAHSHKWEYIKILKERQDKNDWILLGIGVIRISKIGKQWLDGLALMASVEKNVPTPSTSCHLGAVFGST